MNALRAFEAAARHGSFVAAADELNVTPGAISQHIKALEGWAGVTLFRRNAQGVQLTPAARSLSREFTEAFDALASATQSLRNQQPNADIHIAALPSVAQLWLPARLGRIRKSYPDINFSVTALESPPNLTREFFDLSVFFAIPDGSAEQVVLARDIIFPVCTPALAEDVAKGRDLGTLPLLHDQTWQDDWAIWSDKSGRALADPQKGPRYSLYSLAVEEAKSGAGVLMGHACLIEQALHTGLLCPLFPERCESGLSLVLNRPHRTRRRSEVDEIADLLSQSVQSPDTCPENQSP